MHNKLHNKLPGTEFTGETLTSSTRAAAACQRSCAALSRRPLPGAFQQKSALWVRSDCPCHPGGITIRRRRATTSQLCAESGQALGVRWLDTALDAWIFGLGTTAEETSTHPKRCRATALQELLFGIAGPTEAGRFWPRGVRIRGQDS